MNIKLLMRLIRNEIERLMYKEGFREEEIIVTLSKPLVDDILRLNPYFQQIKKPIEGLENRIYGVKAAIDYESKERYFSIGRKYGV